MFMNEEMSGTEEEPMLKKQKRKEKFIMQLLNLTVGVMSPRGFGFDADGEQDLKNSSHLHHSLYPII